jgi:hypothetical protein
MTARRSLGLTLLGFRPLRVSGRVSSLLGMAGPSLVTHRPLLAAAPLTTWVPLG